MKKKNLQSGMSLIEVIVAMVMLASLVALYAAAINTLTVSRRQRYEDLAYHVANTQMETLRATSFASLPSSGTISNSLLSSIPSGSGSFTVVDYPGYSGMKEMTVTVSWTDNKSRSVTLKTLAGSGGINP